MLYVTRDVVFRVLRFRNIFVIAHFTHTADHVLCIPDGARIPIQEISPPPPPYLPFLLRSPPPYILSP